MRVACLAPSADMDYAPVFERVLTAIDEAVDVSTFYPHEHDLPDGHGFDRVIITGSEFHVYDRQDWVEELQDYVLTAMDRGIPVLGVCYGHQLLADALGGTVEQLDVPDQEPLDDREMGFNRIWLTDAGKDSILLDGFPSPFWSFTSHSDYVAALPETAISLARNPYGNHAFHDEQQPAYGIQFHPEYDRDLAETLLDDKELPEEQERVIRATFTAERMEKASNARRVFDTFLHEI